MIATCHAAIASRARRHACFLHSQEIGSRALERRPSNNSIHASGGWSSWSILWSLRARSHNHLDRRIGTRESRSLLLDLQMVWNRRPRLSQGASCPAMIKQSTCLALTGHPYAMRYVGNNLGATLFDGFCRSRIFGSISTAQTRRIRRMSWVPTMPMAQCSLKGWVLLRTSRASCPICHRKISRTNWYLGISMVQSSQWVRHF